VRAACAAEEDFPSRLEVALRTSLDFLAADPDLAYLLTVDPGLGLGETGIDAGQRWIGRFGDLLREAAAADPRAARWPSFLVPFLIDAVRSRIARFVLDGEAGDLPRLLPDLREVLLAYYFEPGESRCLAPATPDGRD
jgi:hypothetical protein